MYNSILLARLDIKVPAIPSAAHVRLPNRQFQAFLQERIQNAVKRSRKKPRVILRGRAQKMCEESEESGGGVQKR